MPIKLGTHWAGAECTSMCAPLRQLHESRQSLRSAIDPVWRAKGPYGDHTGRSHPHFEHLSKFIECQSVMIYYVIRQFDFDSVGVSCVVLVIV